MIDDIRVSQIEWHRNGIGGVGFHAVLFDFAEDGERSERFLASVFPDHGHISVVSLDRIAQVGVRSGENSWRGDRFEPALRKAIAERATAPGKHDAASQTPPAPPKEALRKRRVLGS